MTAFNGLILPDLDIWIRAFDRHHPDPRIVHDLSRRIQSRQVVLATWVHQGLLARVTDERHVLRLRWILAGFPSLRAREADLVRAADIVRRLRRAGQACTPWQAQAWALVERVDGVIWSQDRRWQTLSIHGCPLRAAV